MQKLFRSLVLVATVSVIAAPALHADVMGTNPRPSISVVTPSFGQRLMSFFGF